jgi:hypothetical protein
MDLRPLHPCMTTNHLHHQPFVPPTPRFRRPPFLISRSQQVQKFRNKSSETPFLDCLSRTHRRPKQGLHLMKSQLLAAPISASSPHLSLLHHRTYLCFITTPHRIRLRTVKRGVKVLLVASLPLGRPQTTEEGNRGVKGFVGRFAPVGETAEA